MKYMSISINGIKMKIKTTMNENLNLVEVLKDCPKGTKLYSTVYGDVEFEGINDIIGPIIVTTDAGNAECFTADGKMYNYYNGECTLFPSKDQRDWGKFKPNKPKFDPKTLQPFDKVLVKYLEDDYWTCDLFSNIAEEVESHPCLCVSGVYDYCIPYNDDTKHILATNKEVPEFYRYWEN